MPNTVGGIRATMFAATAACGSLLVGILILSGGSRRFSSPGLASVRQIAPWWAWGTLMVVFGALALVGASRHYMWVSRIGHGLAAVVYLFFVVGLIDTAAQSPTGALTGIGIYGAFGFIHTLAAATADEGRKPVARVM